MGFPYTFGSARYGGFPFSYSMKGLIYIATNLYNGRSYVGQTRTSLTQRRKQHLRDAIADSVNHFHLALMQYGKEAFEWRILDEFSGSKEEVIHALNVAEEYHILKHRTMLEEHGYNATRGGYSSDRFSDTIKKRALANYGGKAVLQYDLNGNFIREYESVASACRSLGVEKQKGAKFIGRAWKGYQWREKLNEYYPQKIEKYENADTQGVGVLVYTTDGRFYKEYSSIKKLRKGMGRGFKIRDGFDKVSIRSHVKDTYLVFRKINDAYPTNIEVEIIYPKKDQKKSSKSSSNECQGRSVLQYSIEGKFIKEFKSISEAHKETGASATCIRKSCKKGLPFAVDIQTKWIWRYSGENRAEHIEVYARRNEGGSYTPKMEHRVLQISSNGEVIKIWKNMFQASIQTGESHNLIRKSCMGIPTRKQTKFIWKFYSPNYPQKIASA